MDTDPFSFEPADLAECLDVGGAALRLNRLHHALQWVRKGLARMLTMPGVSDLPCGWPEGDRLLRAIGIEAARREGVSLERRADPRRWVYITTQLYLRGGHTALTADLIHLGPGDEHRVLVTEFSEPNPELERRVLERLGLDEAGVIRFPGGSQLGCFRWLLGEIDAYNPGVVVLLHHPFDVAATAAALSAPGRRVILAHHNDGVPSAGLHLPGTDVVDITPFRFGFSRQVLGLSPSYLPLTAPPVRPGSPPPSGDLLTCSSGNDTKFSLDYAYPYPSVVARRLRDCPGTHLHIGSLSRALGDALTRALADAGVARSRFHHTRWVRSLAGALYGAGVHVCLGTFPRGGARATVEALSAGIPQIWHSPSAVQDPECLHLKYPEALYWRTPDDLTGILNAVDGPWREIQRAAARRHYDRFHSPDAFRDALTRILAGETVTAPPLPPGPDPFEGLRMRYEAYRREEGLTSVRCDHHIIS